MSLFETNDIAKDILNRYQAGTPGSKAHLEEAAKWLPGGDTRRVSFYPPYPAFMDRGQGCRLYDVDGNEYLDLQNNYTSMIHGHAHPHVEAAAMEQLKKGVVLGSAGEIQYRHARHLCERIPSLDMVRYCNSGTEATMNAIRTARAFTGKHAIMKMDGGYHGAHEFVQVNIFPDLEAEGLPRAYAAPYIPQGVVNGVVVVPFNNLEAAEDAMKANQDRLAAVIMEPCLGAGGGLEPLPGYLEGMRELTNKYGLLLIFDEVMMFRVHYGGMQAQRGVIPDITALGKIIGGGFPVGAFGGRRDIMELYNPGRSDSIFHSGTFTGNNITMAAGLAALELYDRAAIDRINALGERLRQGLAASLAANGIKALPLGIGSLTVVHWREDRPYQSKDAILGFARAGDIPALVHLDLLNRGVHAAPRGLFALSTVMTEEDVDQVARAFGETMELLRPLVAELRPDLVVDAEA